jgi:hypothetical protein
LLKIVELKKERERFEIEKIQISEILFLNFVHYIGKTGSEQRKSERGGGGRE